MSDDGKYLAFRSNEPGQAIAIMNTQTKQIIGTIPGNAGSVASMTFSPDGQYLAVSNLENYKLNIYEIPSLQIIKSINPGRTFKSIGITTNNSKIVGGIGQVLELISLITKISKIENESDILFPNPTDNSIKLEYNLPISSELNFLLFNSEGKKIKELKRAFYMPGQYSEDFQLAEIAPGAYFLKIESLHYSKTFKLIVK